MKTPQKVPAATPAPAKQGNSLSQAIEAAQSQAILDAYTKGITDPAKQGALMKAAREKAKAEFAKI